MPHPVKAKKSSTARHEAIQGYLFVTPYLIAFTIFTGIPFVSAFVLSFLDVKFITRLDDVHFVAFKNFIRFFSNKEALAALGRTGLYTLIYVPVIMVLSFILAHLLNKGVFWAKGIRSMFFLPYVSNMVAVAVVFQLMLGPRGPFYLLQKFFGVEDPIIPLLNQKWALPVVVLIAVWKGIGLNFLTYLGALQNVDKSQVEAAEIDGANKWQQIKNVVIPAVAPTTFFLTISSIITSLQNFTVILSDGRWTKEQVKAEYQRRGYSIVAFTDHRHYGWHPELMDDGFVPLAAYEADLNEPFPPSGSFQRVRTYHLNFYDTDPVARGGFEAVQPPQRYGDMEALNGFIARMNGDGFLCCYNHPYWSLQNCTDYQGLQGVFAMEIYNHGCELDGLYGYAPQAYDEMLRAGQKLFCVATDDNHDVYAPGDPRCDSFGGFTMFKLEKLTYASVIEAMKRAISTLPTARRSRSCPFGTGRSASGAARWKRSMWSPAAAAA